MDPSLVRRALAGLFAAWAASSLSMTVLALSRLAGFKAFVVAFGFGTAFRVTVLAGLAAWTWGETPQLQSAVVVTYIFGTLFLLLVEFRHLKRT